MKRKASLAFLIYISLVFLPGNVFSQSPGFSYYQNVPVFKNGRMLKAAWAGGLQAPQFGKIDLNNDGIKDLVVFDRYDNRLLTFLNSGLFSDTAYTFAPEYAAFFPADISSWLVLHDYNCDGREDIFTATASGVRVYRNTSVGGNLSFRLERAELRAVNSRILISPEDFPAITDVDNDGDTDILSFTLGSNYVSFFRNMRVEQNLPCDSMQFRLEATCWGQFEESATSPVISLHVSCKSSGRASGTNRHAGSTLLLFDEDNDGDKDALIGDVASNNLVFLRNGGSPAFAEMTSQTTAYPAAFPAGVYTFPAAFYLDVNNDQLPDLLLAPNSSGESGFRNYEQVPYYRNTGTAAAPVFTFQKQDFLVGAMLDVGAGAAPAFFDYDGDGILDLVIGNYAYEQGPTGSRSQLALFRNTGTNSSPAYTFITNDFASLSTYNKLSLAPTFGDLDGDGDADMLLGDLLGNILFFRNTAPAGQPASFTLVTDNLLGQSIGGNVVPRLADLDRDGDLDLLIGERNGNLNFYRNTGSSANHIFTLETSSFGGINVRNPQAAAGYAAPFITDLDNNGRYDLLVGDIDGRIRYYRDIETNLSGNFTETPLSHTNSLTNQSTLLKPSFRVIPAAQDLTGDGIPELIAGLYRGGLQLFRYTGMVTGIRPEWGVPQQFLQAFPNPVEDELTLQTEWPWQKLAVQVQDLAGRPVFVQQFSGGAGKIKIELQQLPPGVYVLTAAADGQHRQRMKILKIKP